MGMEEWLDGVAYVQCVCYITFFVLFSLSWSLSHLHTGEDRQHPWMSSQHTTGHYFKIWGFGTLLKGPFAVL